MLWGFPWWLSGKEHACQFRKRGFKPWVRRLPGKEVATHSHVLAWKISWTEESGGLQFMRVERIRHDSN